LTYDANKIVKRHFLTYNHDNILTREIEDNGNSKNPADLSSVTVRKIKEIQLIQQGPYLNIPETIEEKYWDGSTERLLKRTLFTYTTGGAVAAQEVFDANATYCYALTTKYDTKGRPLKEGNALGQTAISEYDEVGNKTFFKDFSGSTLRMEYNILNHVTHVNENDLRDATHDYDKRGNRISTKDFRGYATHFVYDAYDRLLETRLPTGACLKKSYDGAGREISTTDARGYITTRRNNAYGKPIEILHPDGTKELFIYNLDGTLKTHTDQNSIQTHYTYDCFGRVTSKKVQENEETFSYNAFNLFSKTDAEGNTTFYTYDGAGRKIAEAFDTQRTEYRYDALGRVSEVKHGDLVIVKEYDLLNRVLSEKKQSKDGSILAQEDYEYDAAGNQTTVVRYPNNQKAVELSTYDSFNRLVRKIDALGHETTIEHYNKALQKITTDPLGNRTIETYDPKERLISCAKENKQGKMLSLEEHTYDASDNLVKQQSSIFTAGILARRVTTLWQYDSLNRLTTLTEASGTDEEKTTTHIYTPKGLLAQKTKPDGIAIQYTYDAFDRCVETRSSDGTIHYTFYYNAIGQLLSSKDEITGITTQKHWNANGQLLHEILGNDLSLTSTYDEQGRRLSLTLPDNSWIAYSYDPLYLRSVTRHTEHTSYTHHFTHYDLAENLQKEELIHSLGILEYQNDALSRKCAMSCPYYAQQILAFDKVGNILSMKFPEESVDYVYDDLYQLTQETGLFAHTYAYDSHFNRVSKDDTTYHINALNQNSLFHYDSNGNPLSHLAQRMQYDALDRLISVEDSQHKLVFTYDADHRRLSKHVYTSENGQWILQKQLYFLYDGKNEIGSFNEQDAFQELRILGRTTHAEIGSALALEIQGILYAPIHDLQGNLCTLVPVHAPQKAERYRFSAFGEEYAPEATSPWRFSSKRTDESSLVYYGRRYYSPHLGRWLTPDPLGLSAGINLYAFVSNDPLIRLDDYGLMDYGQHYHSWRDQQEANRRFYTAGIHEFYNQVVGIGRFVSSTPHYLELGLNYCTFSNTSFFDGWQQKHNQFFKSAENWIHRLFLTDESHSDYSTYRTGWFVSSLLLPVPGKGMINGARGIAKFGTAAWEGKKVINGLRKPFPKGNLLFGQSSVSAYFSERGCFGGRSIAEVAKDLRSKKISPDELPIRIILRNGKWVTLNNRSLLALKRAKMEPTILNDVTGIKKFEELLDKHLLGNLPSDVIKIRGGPPGASLIEP
jgi:RHS repeat-associated protein